jgi:hypothetical protein
MVKRLRAATVDARRDEGDREHLADKAVGDQMSQILNGLDREPRPAALRYSRQCALLVAREKCPRMKKGPCSSGAFHFRGHSSGSRAAQSPL